MPASRFSPIERDTFRGLNTVHSPTDVPANFSPDCRNVVFSDGRVSKRPGTRFFAYSPALAVVSLKEYAKLDTSDRMVLALNSIGVLSKEQFGIFTQIADDFVESTLKGDLVMNSVTMFGREYMAFSQLGRAGIAKPRQFDDENLDPVAPEGPGAPPVVADGAVDATFGLSAGIHKVRQFFRTRTGYWTTLSPPVEYNAPGGKLMNVSQLAIGPDWVTGRVIAVTPEGSDDYYFIAGSLMEIADNTTDLVNGIGWGSDAVLISGTAVSSQVDASEDQLRLASLPAQAGVVAFKNRLGWWGERATISRANDEGFLNLTFNGGVASLFPDVPLGWEEVTGGGTVADVTGNVGRSYKITGTGAGGAAINNVAKPLGILPHGVAIHARMRARRSPGAVDGTVHLLIATPSTVAAGTGDTFEIDVSQLSDTEWRVVTGVLLPANANVPAPDWVLRLSEGAGGGQGDPITAGEWIAIDDIEIFPASDPLLKSQIRWSKVDDPESYDDLYGRQFVNEDDGQDIRVCFVVRENCYAAKERSLYRINDNPDSEPSGWGATLISSTVGTRSPNGVGHGDGWSVIASRDGLYMFDGSRTLNISEEIEPTWGRINDKYAHTIRVLVNTETQEIFVAAPLDGATRPTHILYLSYAGGSPANPDVRDWTIWDLPVSSMTFSERTDGTRMLFMGTNVTVGNAQIVSLDDTATNDYVGTIAPAAIDAYYQTDYIGRVTGRLLFGYMTAEIDGVGRLLVTASPIAQPDYQIATKYLDPVLRYDREWILSLSGERVAFKFRVAGVGERFELRKLALFVKIHPWMKIRGLG